MVITISDAIVIEQRIFQTDWLLTTKNIVAMVAIKLAGIRKAQIVTQFWRENSKSGSKSNMNS
jgi:hypothetical protein